MTIWTTIAQQGPGFNWGGILQFVIIFLAIGAPVLGWVGKKIKEQADIKAARARQRDKERESLRSTQVVTRTSPGDERAETADRQAAMRELAKRRQAQLQELRERQIEAARQRQSQQQQQRQQQQPEQAPASRQHARREVSRDDGDALTGSPTPKVRTAAMPAAPSPPQGVPVRQQPVIAPTQRRRPDQQGPQRGPVQPQRTLRQEQQRQQQKPAAPAGPQVRPLIDPRPIGEAGGPAPLEQRYGGVRRKSDRLGIHAMFFNERHEPRSKDELRRVFALSEIFSKPVSLREGPGGHAKL